MKYFRTYPWGLQLTLFLLMAFTLMSSATVIIANLVPKFWGVSFAQLTSISPDSPASIINASLIVNVASNFYVFFLSGFLFAYLAHPRPAAYLGLKAPGKKIQPLLAVLLILGAMPVLEFIETLVGMINFGANIKAEQQAFENTMGAFMNISSFGSFIKLFLFMAIVPALSEEVFFRGVLMRFAKKRSKTMTMPIIFSAAVFAFAHFNIYGIVSIFLAGVLLAVIYYLTGSLWCSMLAHLVFNGWQIAITYAGNSNAAIKRFLDNPSLSYFLVVGGAVLFCISLYLLLKNKTPLPPNWTDDYSAEELQQINRPDKSL